MEDIGKGKVRHRVLHLLFCGGERFSAKDASGRHLKEGMTRLV